jgi:hypothetical protein
MSTENDNEWKAKTPSEMASMVLNGNISPLKVFAEATKKEQAYKELKTVIKDAVIEEVRTYGNKGTRVAGCVITERNTGARYDYEADQEYKDIKTELKEREKLLKHRALSKDAIFDGDGVEVPKIPVKDYGTATVAVKVWDNDYWQPEADPEAE